MANSTVAGSREQVFGSHFCPKLFQLHTCTDISLALTHSQPSTIPRMYTSGGAGGTLQNVMADADFHDITVTVKDTQITLTTDGVDLDTLTLDGLIDDCGESPIISLRVSMDALERRMTRTKSKNTHMTSIN